jgi:hypothetical protein
MHCIEKLNERLPKQRDGKLNKFVPDDDWLLWDSDVKQTRGKRVETARR